MAQLRTTGLEQELAAETASNAVGATASEREKVEQAREQERREQLARLEREAREEK